MTLQRTMQVKLSDDEKNSYCVLMGKSLKRLRNISGMTQDDLENISGISKERISRMENGSITMRWTQFISFLTVFTMRSDTKDFLLASEIITPRLLQALQSKDEHVMPDIDVPVSSVISQKFYSSLC